MSILSNFIIFSHGYHYFEANDYGFWDLHYVKIYV